MQLQQSRPYHGVVRAILDSCMAGDPRGPRPQDAGVVVRQLEQEWYNWSSEEKTKRNSWSIGCPQAGLARPNSVKNSNTSPTESDGEVFLQITHLCYNGTRVQGLRVVGADARALDSFAGSVGRAAC